MKRRYKLEGLDCADCASRIEEELKNHSGLDDVRVSFATQSVVLDMAYEGAAAAIIQRGHPHISLVSVDARNAKPGIPEPQGLVKSLTSELACMAYSAILAAFGIIMSWQGVSDRVTLVVFILSYLPVGLPVLRTAVRNLTRGNVLDENFLMGIATLGAFALGQYLEAVSVMLFYSVGEYFQDMAVNKSRKSITGLLDLRPESATVRTPEGVRTLHPEAVDPGAIILVKPGERIPLDGEVIEGVSSADTSALTGESVPRTLDPGEPVMSGWVNGQGLLAIRVTKPYSESSVSRILELVENAASNKAPTEAFITKFAKYYTPTVVLGAALIAIVPPLVFGAPFSVWAYKALVLLVISCPCALVLSIPLTYFAGLGTASRRGVLIKGSNHLDALVDVGAVAFDKTGTLTRGVFKVVRVTPWAPTGTVGMDGDALLALAAGAERHSSHPIGKSLVEEALRRGLEESPPDDGSPFEERRGHGVIAWVDGHKVIAGRSALLQDQGISPDPQGGSDYPMVPGETTVHIAVDGRYAGSIGISDQIKPRAGDGIARIKAMGVRKLTMLTGDREESAAAVAASLDIDDYRAGLLPEGKVDAVDGLKASVSGTVIFVGDGINDAPVLMRSDIGVAMGGLGSDAAIEAADVVIMDDDISRIADAISVSRFTRKLVVQNITLTLVVKGFFIILGLLGVATVWEAVISDVGVALLAVMNGIRKPPLPERA